jgi:hypothetical protein
VFLQIEFPLIAIVGELGRYTERIGQIVLGHDLWIDRNAISKVSVPDEAIHVVVRHHHHQDRRDNRMESSEKPGDIHLE